MKDTLDRLRMILETIPPRLRGVSEAESVRRPAADKWSRKEILGHLVDSASNNHQGFVRAQLVEDLHFPPYEQGGWVTVQRYLEEPWETIIQTVAGLQPPPAPCDGGGAREPVPPPLPLGGERAGDPSRSHGRLRPPPRSPPRPDFRLMRSVN